jgi:hypothetical protein
VDKGLVRLHRQRFRQYQKDDTLSHLHDYPCPSSNFTDLGSRKKGEEGGLYGKFGIAPIKKIGLLYLGWVALHGLKRYNYLNQMLRDDIIQSQNRLRYMDLLVEEFVAVILLTQDRMP